MSLIQETLLLYGSALLRPVVEAAEAGYALDTGDAACYRAAFQRPVVEVAEAKDDLDAGDAAPL